MKKQIILACAIVMTAVMPRLTFAEQSYSDNHDHHDVRPPRHPQHHHSQHHAAPSPRHENVH